MLKKKVLIFALPKFRCVVVTANLFLRLKMFDPYNLSKEQDWVLTEQLMMIHQPVNPVFKEERAMWIFSTSANIIGWLFFFRFENPARGWLTNCLKVSGHISFVFSKSLTYIYPNTPPKTIESALTAFNILSVFVPGNNMLLFSNIHLYTVFDFCCLLQFKFRFHLFEEQKKILNDLNLMNRIASFWNLNKVSTS